MERCNMFTHWTFDFSKILIIYNLNFDLIDQYLKSQFCKIDQLVLKFIWKYNGQRMPSQP